MANNKALPLLLLGGVALFALGGKKSKKEEGSPGEPYTDWIPDEEPPAPGESSSPDFSTGVDLKAKCRGFLEEIYVVPNNADELPINEIAVEQSILPAINSEAMAIWDEKGHQPHQEDVPRLVLKGLESVFPSCGFSHSDQGWRYADDDLINDPKLIDVLDAIYDLAQDKAVAEAGFSEGANIPNIDDGKVHQPGISEKGKEGFLKG